MNHDIVVHSRDEKGVWVAHEVKASNYVMMG